MPLLRVGVISDTHGLLRDAAADYLRGSDLIVHAGDIGTPDVIGLLEGIAPVHAIRGNVDRGDWALAYPETARIEIADRVVFLIHDVNALDDPTCVDGVDAVISGHSHKPRAESRDGVLYFNPGSAGPRRFRLPVTVGRLWIGDGDIRHEIEELRV